MVFDLVPQNTNPFKSARTKKLTIDHINILSFKIHLTEFVTNYCAEGKTLEESIDEIQNALYKMCVINCKRKSRVRADAVWWTPDLEIKRSRVRALRRFQRTAYDEERLIRKLKFKKEMAEYTQSIAIAKINSFRSFLNNVLKVNSFDTFYSLVQDSVNNYGQLCPIKIQDGSTTGSFRDSMLTILEYHFPRDCGTIIRRQTDLEYRFPLVTVHEIEKIFQDINLTKAPGPDGLCANIIYEFFKKQASVALIPKVGKYLSSPSAYRPICLLSTWGKVLDKIFSRRLTFELEKTGKLHPNQFGFRNGRSTLDALQFFKDFVHSSKLNEHVTIAISLDMSNAFNSVEGRDVISALHEDGVPDYLIFSISDFLNNRKIVDPNLQPLRGTSIDVTGFTTPRVGEGALPEKQLPLCLLPASHGQQNTPTCWPCVATH
ncbi:Retrovirus-related Pol polyprotein from type-1 retrotransposable element R1 [Araneus ventricosus]|uniref:Retrovirus-related Pol polyprotein from type-1 retrotransposable element R1 n=1 Tax=Araneus ventricosus TaxID=182803 RepID=A0A4Y2L1H5_ARAVE|nr:Retrovirus-related Pol polyprotein from type-1 retrotransposable element R1 [Araneus ventricosus]